MESLLTHVIVADDDPNTLEIYQDILTGQVEHLYFVQSGVELINKLIELQKQQIKVELILLDEQMPHKGGSATLDILPTIHKDFAEIKILSISGNHENFGPGVPSIRKNTCLMAKPFTLKDFNFCLRCKALSLEANCPAKDKAKNSI